MDLTDKYLVSPDDPDAHELYVLAHHENVAICLVHTNYGRLSIKAFIVDKIMDYGIVNAKPKWMVNLYKLAK